MRTEHYVVLENAQVHTNSDHSVHVRVAFHDGGEMVREWDKPDIEIEIVEAPNE